MLLPFTCLFMTCEIINVIWSVSNCFWNTALNEALKQEVERLKIATGEMASQSDAYNFGMQQHLPYTQSSFYSQKPQGGPSDAQQMQMPQFHSLQSNMLNHHHPMLTASHSQSQAFSEMLHHDSLGRLRGLDINARGSHLVKSEGPSISASESSSTFWSNGYDLCLTSQSVKCP